MSFYEEIVRFRGFDFAGFLHSVKSSSIERILNQDSFSEMDFLSLLSPAALAYIEPLARKANRLTLSNFGKVIHLYAPLYLANYCENDCAYCGFKHSNAIERKKLSLPELEQEAKQIAKTGIRHLLVLTGESRLQSPLTYIKECIKLLAQYFSSISVEIYPLQEEEYASLIAAGADGLTIYQETYDEALYKVLHPIGPKGDYRFRLDAAQRAGLARMRQVNIGALLGLADFPKDAFFSGLHAYWLMRHYPDAEAGISLPRVQPQVSNFSPAHPVLDRQLAQIIIAMRLFLPRAGITISTREKSDLRQSLIGLGVTRMSAGSRTEVGGYTLDEKTVGQFEIADKSSVSEVKEMIEQKGYQAVFKDWQGL
ncbi:MAG: 2-iminoacetate synthase ThiH [Candidatus Omnitrophota bacterium]|nr:2-iminoacetate synthase ThiH [Candidatus Omnitrophota bacterium]